MPTGEARLRQPAAWQLRARTVLAMVLLGAALLLVKLVPFRLWRATLGRVVPGDALAVAADGRGGPARRVAVHVERAAARLPLATKCLPRAMALCWMLRRAGIAYVLKIAARPAALRQGAAARWPERDDALHAWVESDNTVVLGDLPGPWLVVLRLAG